MSVKTQPLQEAFNAGEFGKRMAGRVQFGKYQNAGATFENILPLPQGGFTSRSGSRYVIGAKSNSVRPWLMPFVFSTTQAYMIELGETAMRFFRNQGQITAADIGATVSNGAFPTDLTDWDDNSNGSGAIAHDATNLDMNLVGAGASNEAIATQDIATTTTAVEHVVAFQIVGDPGDEIVVRVGSSQGASDYHSDVKRKTGYHTIEFTPSASPFYLEFENQKNKTISIDNVSLFDNAAIDVTTPWAEADLDDLSFAQSADVLYVAQGGAVRPYRLDRYGHSAWGLTKVLFTDGPYLDTNITATTFLLSATSGNAITVTASAVTGINNDVGFRATDVGRLIRWKDAAGNWTWMQIVTFTDTTHVKADILGPDASATTATVNWRLGEWNDTDGWPSVVSFLQQRLALAAATSNPQKFHLSKSADIENMADSDADGTVQDDSSVSYQFAAREVNTIRWIASRKKPVIGTQGGEWTLRSEGAVLTPTDIAADFEVSGGTAPIPPVEVRSRLLFAQAQKRKIVEFADTLQDNGIAGFDSFDLTLLNDRVLQGGVVQLAYQQEPDSTIWSARTDGQMPVLTYQPEQDVVGWSRQIMGGSFQGGGAVVESIAVIPGQDGSGQFKDSTGRHEVWVAVKREVNGSTVRYIEVFEKLYNGDEDLQEDAFYVDSGLTLDTPLTITGITKADPGVVTATAHGFSDGDLVRIVRVKGMTEVNGKSYKVANKAANTFELNDPEDATIDTSAFTTYSTGGEVRKKVTAVSGLTHLEGETVQVFADGATQTTKTVASGAITIDSAASVIHVGLSYARRFKSLKLAVQTPVGTSIGTPQSIADIILELMETAEGALQLATEEDGVEGTFTQLDLRDATEVGEDPVPFFDGVKSLGVSAGFDDDIRLILTGSDPSPFTVLGLSPEVDTATG
jgi:hypothetical protein